MSLKPPPYVLILTMGMLWILFDPKRETQSERLTTEDAQFAIQRLKSKYLNRYLIWNSTWTKWKQLNEFLRSEESPFTNNYNSLADTENPLEYEKTRTLLMKLVEPREALKIHSTISEINTNIVEVKSLVPKSKKQFDGDDLSTDDVQEPLLNLNFSSLSVSSAFRKRNTEDKYKIELLMMHRKGLIFRTTAKDISLTGTYSERIVPNDFHNGEFEMIIINNLIEKGEHKQIKIKCRVIFHDGITYIQYLRPNIFQIKLLRKVLSEYREIFEDATESTSKCS